MYILRNWYDTVRTSDSSEDDMNFIGRRKGANT